MEQAEALDEALVREGKQIDKAIYIQGRDRRTGAPPGRPLELPAVRRRLPRGEPAAEAVGVCDNCGSQLYQREDDRPEVVRTRLVVNLKNLEPLLDHYGRQGKLSKIDGERAGR